MLFPKPIRLMLAVPAVCTVLFIGLDFWYDSDANRLAGNPNTSDVCFTYPLRRPVQDRCESRSRAAFAASVGAAVLALLVAAYLALNWITARVWSGRLSFLTGCRWGYGIALGASAVAWITFVAVLYPMAFLLTFIRLLGSYWLEFDNFMIGICSLGAIAGLVGFFRRDAESPIPNDVYLRGTVATESEQRHLFKAIQQIARSAKCNMPRNVVLGLDPAVICTHRRVCLERTELTGGTLYLSLLYHRLLSESELMSLATIALLPAQMVPGESEVWLVTTGQRWARRRQRLQEASLPVIGIAMTLVWNWLDLWDNWQANIAGVAIRRAAVVTGRENVAGALSKADFCSRSWPPFLTEIQVSLRRSEVQAEQVNLSEMFAARMAERADELAGEVVSSPWMNVLGVDVEEMKRRVRDVKPARETEWIAGLESLEKEQSMEQIKRMVFLRESANPATSPLTPFT
jgi:hypothetical protein